MNIHVVENKEKSSYADRVRDRSDEEMARIKTAYEGSGTILSVALDFRLSEHQLRVLARRHGWIRPIKAGNVLGSMRERLNKKAVLEMIEKGFSRAEIAERFSVPTHAVHDFVSAVRKAQNRYRNRDKAPEPVEASDDDNAEPDPVSKRVAKPGTVIWNTENKREITLPAVSFISGVDRRTG